MSGPSRRVRGMRIFGRGQEHPRGHACTEFNLFHLKIQSNEEGMRLVTEMGQTFRDIHLCWLGPVIPVLRLVDPAFVAPLLQAPGIPSRIPTNGSFSVSYLSSFYPSG